MTRVNLISRRAYWQSYALYWVGAIRFWANRRDDTISLRRAVHEYAMSLERIKEFTFGGDPGTPMGQSSMTWEERERWR